MKIATWNVNGIRARQAQVCEWVAREQPDIVCLQELKAEPSQIPEQCKLADYYVYWHGTKGYSGVSLHVSKAFVEGEPVYTHPAFDMETRMVQVTVGNVVFASVYVPNGGKSYPAKIEFMQQLRAWSKALHAAGREVVLCGDINIARTEMDVHPRENKPGVIGQRPEERALFEALLGDELVDVGRALDPDNPKSIAERAQSCTVLRDVGTSDHAPVMMIT
ncbi:MAG: exodeoxyribonuclease III [Pseudomonadota bacterium]